MSHRLLPPAWRVEAIAGDQALACPVGGSDQDVGHGAGLRREKGLIWVTNLAVLAPRLPFDGHPHTFKPSLAIDGTLERLQMFELGQDRIPKFGSSGLAP